MDVSSLLRTEIQNVGVKEVARRTGLAASTVSRIASAQISPGFEIVQKILEALGFSLVLQPKIFEGIGSRLSFAKNVLGRLRKRLKAHGVKHAVIFGSVARQDDGKNSDIDIYLDFGDGEISVKETLTAEGLVIDSFRDLKVDVVSHLNSPRGLRLKKRIEQEGVRVF